MKKILILAVAVIALSLAGCMTVSVPMAADTADAQAKAFTPQPGMANIYVYRDTGFGWAASIPISINGQVVGQTVGHTYCAAQVPPGIYTVVALAENTSSVAITVQAGQNYFVQQNISMGWWKARSDLVQVDETTGRVGVLNCRLVQFGQ
jgi:hypothetical protein